MMQSFKYIPIVASQNPMDFNYKFGFNDNSPDRFCYTDALANIGSAFTQQSQLFKSNVANDLISFKEILNNDDMVSNFTIIESPYKVRNHFTNNIKRLKAMKSLDISAMNTKTAINSVKQAFNITMTGLNMAASNYQKSVSVQASKNTDSAGEVMDLVNSVLVLATNISSMAQTIEALKSKETTFEKQVNNQIALLNESIEASREFREQAQAELDRRHRKK